MELYISGVQILSTSIFHEAFLNIAEKKTEGSFLGNHYD